MSVGRNDPCPCGSGQKYKKCCLAKETAPSVAEAGWLRMRRTEGELMHKIAAHMMKHYGPESIGEAWDEYTGWPDQPADQDEWPEFEDSFWPWFLFDWTPDLEGPDQDHETFEVSPARHFVERKGAYLDSYERRYIDTVCEAPITFYLVVESVPGEEITLRDIFRQREVTVHERQASASLQPGQMIFTKVVEMDGEAVMLGCSPFPIPNHYFDAVVSLREHVAKNHPMDAATLREFDMELHRLYLDLREELVDPAPPALQNTDGDPLQMTRIEYELDCSPQDAYLALLPLTLEDDPAGFEDECQRDSDGNLVSVEIPWLRLGNAQNPGWENTVLGHIEIRRGRLIINVNSQARADAIQQEIESLLGRLARLKGVAIESVEQMMAAAAEKSDSEKMASMERERAAMENEPELQAFVQKMSEAHWSAWPDIPLPALDGKTPRQAAKTELGRERLETLFLDFSARGGDPSMMGPDVDALRRELEM